jgi:hypothetical protein
MAARQKLDHVYQGQESVERYIERFISMLSDVETEYDICENDKIYMFLRKCSFLTSKRRNMFYSGHMMS